MKKSNKQKIETLLLYNTQSRVAEMLNMKLWQFLEKLSDWSFNAEDEQLISKLKPLKQIVLILSSQFLKDHPRHGEPTYFKQKILNAIFDGDVCVMPDGTEITDRKLHTIRADYDGWVEKVAAVNREEAFIRVVTWKAIPYKSSWEDVCILMKEDGIDVQKLIFSSENIFYPCIDFDHVNNLSIDAISKNDGLLFDDFEAWFKGYDLSKPMAIIHFTKFRY